MRLILAAALASFAMPAVASDDESYDIWEMRKVMEAEIDRARRLNADPAVTLLVGPDGPVVVPAYSDIYDLPEHAAERTQPQN